MSDFQTAIATNAPAISTVQGDYASLQTGDQAYVVALTENSFIVLTVDPLSIVDLLVQFDDHAAWARRSKIRELIITNSLSAALLGGFSALALSDAAGWSHVVNIGFWSASAFVMLGVAGSGILYLRRLCP